MRARSFGIISGGIVVVLLFSWRIALASGPSLGTVFYSPAERTKMVDRRNGVPENQIGGDESDDRGPEAGEAPVPRPIFVGGIVSRSGGRSVVWINGKPVAESMKDESLPSLTLDRDHVIIDGKSVKVGEELDTITGKLFSPLPDGAIKVRP